MLTPDQLRDLDAGRDALAAAEAFLDGREGDLALLMDNASDVRGVATMACSMLATLAKAHDPENPQAVLSWFRRVFAGTEARGGV